MKVTKELQKLRTHFSKLRSVYFTNKKETWQKPIGELKGKRHCLTKKSRKAHLTLAKKHLDYSQNFSENIPRQNFVSPITSDIKLTHHFIKTASYQWSNMEVV